MRRTELASEGVSPSGRSGSNRASTLPDSASRTMTEHEAWRAFFLASSLATVRPSTPTGAVPERPRVSSSTTYRAITASGGPLPNNQHSIPSERLETPPRNSDSLPLLSSCYSGAAFGPPALLGAALGPPTERGGHEENPWRDRRRGFGNFRGVRRQGPCRRRHSRRRRGSQPDGWWSDLREQLRRRSLRFQPMCPVVRAGPRLRRGQPVPSHAARRRLRALAARLQRVHVRRHDLFEQHVPHPM